MLKLKVLLIDDEADYCMIMRNFFTKKNYEVFAAYTLKEGLELLDTVKPDILFLDHNLPDGHGFSYVESIVEKNPHLKLYLVSAYFKKGDLSYPSPNVIVWEKPISISLLNNTF
jgi:DNA-binding response OmpR family regulator